MTATKKAKPTSSNRTHVPTATELAAIKKVVMRAKTPSSVPRVKLENGQISVDHQHQSVGLTMIEETIGATDSDFTIGVLKQLANSIPASDSHREQQLNFLLSAVKSMHPRDPTEAMLAAQMAVVHAATMTFASRLAMAKLLIEQESAERGLNRCSRTFAAQTEALERYRAGARSPSIGRDETSTKQNPRSSTDAAVSDRGRGQSTPKATAKVVPIRRASAG